MRIDLEPKERPLGYVVDVHAKGGISEVEKPYFLICMLR